MLKLRNTFQVGRVKAYVRGRIWYLQYHDNGQGRWPRVGPSLDTTRRLAAQINAQLEAGDVPLLSFDSIAIGELRRRWLEHHEQVFRSSIHTIICRRAVSHGSIFGNVGSKLIVP